MDTASTVGKPRRDYWDCGVPRERCSGFKPVTQSMVRKGYKAHGSHGEARECARRYQRERSKETGTQVIMSKPTLCKMGKEGRCIAPAIR